jgi:hypothetical protein
MRLKTLSQDFYNNNHSEKARTEEYWLANQAV